MIPSSSSSPSLSVSNWSASDRITRVSSIEHSEVKRSDIPLEKEKWATVTSLSDRMCVNGSSRQVCDDGMKCFLMVSAAAAARPAARNTNVVS